MGRELVEELDLEDDGAARKAARVSSTEDPQCKNLGMRSSEPSPTTSNSQRSNATECIEGTGCEPPKFPFDCPDHRGFIRNSTSHALWNLILVHDSRLTALKIPIQVLVVLLFVQTIHAPFFTGPSFPLEPQPHGPFQDPGSTH
jgi:hypothetical protein